MGVTKQVWFPPTKEGLSAMDDLLTKLESQDIEYQFFTDPCINSGYTVIYKL